MDRHVLLVRHAEAVVSDKEPPGAWPLTQAGATAASVLGHRLAIRFPARLENIVTSNERKAIETAAQLGSGQPSIDERLREISKPWYPDPADHQADAIRYLQGDNLPGWEPQRYAVERFAAALSAVRSPFVVVASHGTVMALWLATVLQDFDPVTFWLDLRLPDAHLLTDQAKFARV